MIRQIKELKYAQPFEPFFIELSSGRILNVPTPGHIIVTEGGTGRVVVLNDDGTFSAPSGLHIARVGISPATT
jgi:hypothetical protein